MDSSAPRPRSRRLTALAPLLACLFAAFPSTAAGGGIFGTQPLEISLNPRSGEPNGASGGAAVSGDNRLTRLAAFHSQASNLVGGDTNGVADVFVWSRPKGSAGLTLTKPMGGLRRVSVANGGGQANGPSLNPSLDGSLTSSPHCVAFESTASNLVGSDSDRTSDVFVHDLRNKATYLVSQGVGAAAGDPSIDGRCRRVAFEAGGRVLVAPAHGGAAQSLGKGANPDLSLDDSAIVWERGRNVMLLRNGRRTNVGPGSNPTVSDRETSLWAVTFETKRRLSRGDDNRTFDVYMRTFVRRGGPRKTDLISADRRGGTSLGGNNRNGGLTAYAGRRGIVTFTHTDDGLTTLYYRNNHTGNINELAYADAAGSSPGMEGVVTSSRANFVAFASSSVSDRRGRRRRLDLDDYVPPPEEEDYYYEPPPEELYEEPPPPPEYYEEPPPPPPPPEYEGELLSAGAAAAGGAAGVFFKHLEDGQALP